VLNGRATKLANAILSLERFDRVEKGHQLGGSIELALIGGVPLSLVGEGGSMSELIRDGEGFSHE